MKKGLLFIAILIISTAAVSAQVDTTRVSRLSRDSILIGDQVDLIVDLQLQEGDGFVIAAPSDPLAYGVETIKGMIAEQLNVNPDDIKPESRLIEDLKADSANIMVMIMDLEDQFGITVEDDQIMKLKTVGDVAAYIASVKG